MMFLQPSELNMMIRDFIDLLNGPDSLDITLAWKTGGSAADPIYGDRTGENTLTSVVRGLVVFPTTQGLRLFSNNEKKKKFGEVQAKDAIFMFLDTDPIEGKRDLTLAIEGMGTWRLVNDPPLELAQYATMFPSNQQMIQWCYGRIVK